MSLDGVRRWLTVQPWGLRLVFVAVGLAILGGAAEATWPTRSIYPAIGPVIVVLLTAVWKDRQFWQLPRADRLAVEDAMRTGVSTGSPRLDQIACARLTRRARSFRSDRVLAPPFLLLAAALPIAAAVRTGNAWWLIGSMVLFGQFVVNGGAFPKDPRPALASLSASAN